MRRAIVLVLDGCGAGAAPDAAEFGDSHGPSTLLNVWNAAGGFAAPNLQACGYLAAGGIEAAPAERVAGRSVRWGRLRPRSMGKDSVTGHWEMMGIEIVVPFPTYPDGFPRDLVDAFEVRTGTRTLGNVAGSGTDIIATYGEEHLRTGFPILYTSADSVFQVACHEQVVPIDRLYEICRIGREVCREPHNVQRVIARPFEGVPGSFRRTERRKDFPLTAPANLIDRLGEVHGIGVVPELFGGRGFLEAPRTQSNPEHARALEEAMANTPSPFLFANFEDFDMLYGHRNDPAGFARCLVEFDAVLGEILSRLREDDLLVLTSDHGNDPTDASTDHTREYVPVSVISKGTTSRALGDRDGLADVGATVADHLKATWDRGRSLLA
jgi:phosphopentomutase